MIDRNGVFKTEHEGSIGIWTRDWALSKSIPVVYSEQTSSTNSVAKEFDYRGKKTMLFVADDQTAGRGRGRNTWTNPVPGTSLLSTWCFVSPSAPQPIAAPLIGLAVYSALTAIFSFEKSFNIKFSLKAPNDLYIGNKKLGGLLIEVISEGDQHRLLVGIGLNVFSAPAGLSSATYLAEIEGEGVKNPVGLSSWFLFLDRVYQELENSLQPICQKELTPIDCLRLRTALNLFPGLREKYSAVLADGSLKSEANTIRWTEL